MFGQTGPPILGGPPFWIIKFHGNKLAILIRPEPGFAFILPLIVLLTKEPEMLQPDAFCEHTMQQRATAAGALPRTLLGERTALPQTP